MSFLPSPNVDLSKMSKEELTSLKTHLEQQYARCLARQAHIVALKDNVDGALSKK